MYKEVIAIGAGGHAKVIVDIILKSGDIVIGFLDDRVCTSVLDIPILGKIEDCIKYLSSHFIIAIGDNYTRKRIAQCYCLDYYTAIHPSANIGINVEIGEGCCVMAGSIINTSSKIGKHCVINTGAIVEHDNILEDYVHISPNATLGGTVKIGELSHVGLSATIKNNTCITSECVIGAGSVILNNIESSGIYVGIPARKLEK